MSLSALDLFSVGIGPSSSHTVGPMRAARRFVAGLAESGLLDRTVRVQAQLYGSLGATGHGHGSDRAVVLGLEGEDPETVDTSHAAAGVEAVRADRKIALDGTHRVDFDPDVDLLLHRRRTLPGHPNGMTFEAFDEVGRSLRFRTYYSVGGGFVVDEQAIGADRVVADDTPVAHPFGSGAELLQRCRETGLSVAGVMMANECAWRPEDEVRERLLHLWGVMQECVESGCTREERTLPGGLKVRRRLPSCASAFDARRPTRAALPEARCSTRSGPWSGSTSTPSRSTRRTPRGAASSPPRRTGRPASFPPCCTSTPASWTTRTRTGSSSSS